MRYTHLILLSSLLLTACGYDQQSATQPFSLQGVTNATLPDYTITRSETGDLGNIYYAEWQSKLSAQDSALMLNALADFYPDEHNRYFKCYAEGDSSICIQLSDNGFSAVKEPTAIYKTILRQVEQQSGITLPNDVKPMLFQAYIGFIDASYTIGINRSLIPDETMTKLQQCAAADININDPKPWVKLTEDTIADTPIIIIEYARH